MIISKNAQRLSNSSLRQIWKSTDNLKVSIFYPYYFRRRDKEHGRVWYDANESKVYRKH